MPNGTLEKKGVLSYCFRIPISDPLLYVFPTTLFYTIPTTLFHTIPTIIILFVILQVRSLQRQLSWTPSSLLSLIGNSLRQLSPSLSWKLWKGFSFSTWTIWNFLSQMWLRWGYYMANPLFILKYFQILYKRRFNIANFKKTELGMEIAILICLFV